MKTNNVISETIEREIERILQMNVEHVEQEKKPKQKYLAIEKKYNIIFDITDKVYECYNNYIYFVAISDEEAKKIEETMFNTIITLKYHTNGKIVKSETTKDFVIQLCWYYVLNAKNSYILPPFDLVDNTYYRQTYDMRIMKAYGFTFKKVRDLNFYQYDGDIHGNKTLMSTTNFNIIQK